ncbi:hypothetical protein E2C01_028800 [Portunus trituberculatus]|uniref:Uncharacterized protein n=1 Tax=Portunus trituberculatus TaxID=210409 RepID=A0A5B7EQG7_PORTR|nr:hypothetical protein [Portunus trituberculatus]
MTTGTFVPNRDPAASGGGGDGTSEGRSEETVAYVKAHLASHLATCVCSSQGSSPPLLRHRTP